MRMLGQDDLHPQGLSSFPDMACSGLLLDLGDHLADSVSVFLA